MSYREILASLGIAAVMLVVVFGLVYSAQPEAGGVRLALDAPAPRTGTTPAPVVASVAPQATTPAPAANDSGAEHDLTIVSWGGEYQTAQRIAFFNPFMTETGVELVEAEFNGTLGEVREALEQGRTWDVVDLELADVLSGCDEGLLEPIDWSRVADPADFMPVAVQPCGVGTIVWSFVMGYSPELLPRSPVGWADFWDVEGLPGKRALRKLAMWNLEIALLADGVPTREVYGLLSTPEGVDRAFAKLEQIRPHVVWWESGAAPADMLAAGEVVMATAYNGRLSNARKQGASIGTVWTNVIYTLDYWAILKGTPNIEKAYSFISFASRPERLSVFPRYIPYGPANLKAVPMVDPALAPDLPTTPANLRFAMVSDAGFWNRHGPALERRFKDWVEKE